MVSDARFYELRICGEATTTVRLPFTTYEIGFLIGVVQHINEAADISGYEPYIEIEEEGGGLLLSPFSDE